MTISAELRVAWRDTPSQPDPFYAASRLDWSLTELESAADEVKAAAGADAAPELAILAADWRLRIAGLKREIETQRDRLLTNSTEGD